MANYTILLIDYEPRSIERFRDPLVAAGYTVELATDGVSGIEAFHRLNPDMVLVEAMIPKKHGFEVCQELKRTPHGRRTPILITTGVYKGRKYRTQALHIYGCDEYIEKPIAAEQLLETVGKFFNAGTAPNARPAEATPAPAERAADRSVPVSGSSSTDATSSVEHASAKPERTKPTPVPQSKAADDTEDEIMARLDAILPNGGLSPAVVEVVAEVESIAVVTMVEAPEELPEEFTAVPQSVIAAGDPFAQMRAELDAELGSFSAALAVELAPAAAAAPEPFPSDQMTSPSVFEALPEPVSEIAEATIPLAVPTVKADKPGQVVNFDTKRSRKNKKPGKAGKGRSEEGAVPRTPPQVDSALTREPARTASREIALPSGTMVESALEPGSARRGVPLLMWAGVALLVIGATYFALSRNGAGRASDFSSTATAPAPAPVAPTASNPVSTTPADSASNAPAESATTQGSADNIPPAPVAATPTPEPRKPAAAVPKPAPLKTTAEAVATLTPATVPSKGVAEMPKPAPKPAPKSTTRHESPPAATAAPAAPPEVDDSVAGVEALPEVAAAAAAPATTVAPGTLLPIDEADVMPMSITRKPPVYSLQAREMRLIGTIVMNVLINEHGTVDQVVLVTGINGADLNDAAMRAAKSWTYRPATKQGVAVKVWKSEKVVFK